MKELLVLAWAALVVWGFIQKFGISIDTVAKGLFAALWVAMGYALVAGVRRLWRRRRYTPVKAIPPSSSTFLRD
jgi:hypothetical protein